MISKGVGGSVGAIRCTAGTLIHVTPVVFVRRACGGDRLALVASTRTGKAGGKKPGHMYRAGNKKVCEKVCGRNKERSAHAGRLAGWQPAAAAAAAVDFANSYDC